MDLFFPCLQFPRSDAKFHSQTQIESHLYLALCRLEATQHQVHEFTSVVKDQAKQIERLSQQIKQQSQQIERQSGQIEKLMSSNDKEQSQQIERPSRQIERQPGQIERQSRQIELQSRQIELQSQQIELQSQQIERQSERIGRHTQQIERQSQQIETLLSSYKEQSRQITILKINQILPTPFEWKIPNFEALFLTSSSEKQNLVCEPFYLFECGYKFLLEIVITRPLSPNFLRVYIKVVPGEFDELLSWPCKEKVRVTLVDQNLPLDNKKNISHMISFEMGMEPCSRPLCDDHHKYHPSLGLSKHELRSYITNDTILIRVNREYRDLRN